MGSSGSITPCAITYNRLAATYPKVVPIPTPIMVTYQRNKFSPKKAALQALLIVAGRHVGSGLGYVLAECSCSN